MTEAEYRAAVSSGVIETPFGFLGRSILRETHACQRGTTHPAFYVIRKPESDEFYMEPFGGHSRWWSYTFARRYLVRLIDPERLHWQYQILGRSR